MKAEASMPSAFLLRAAEGKVSPTSAVTGFKKNFVGWEIGWGHVST